MSKTSWGVVFLLAALGGAAQVNSGNGESQGRVDGIFAAYDKADSPGCAVGVVRNGEFVYKRGYGMGSLELERPLSPESVFYMGSISKQFTAASAVLAAEKGYLSLDDDVRKWVPEIPSYGHTITLRHMLHHTSGLRDEIGLVSLAGKYIEDVHPAAEIIDLLARQKALNFNPGDEYQYSNSNYFLLAEVIHRAARMPFSRFAEENIFKPLGMTHTRFYDDRTLVLPGRVAAYSPRDEGGFRVDWFTNFEKVGDGGLMSSVDDLLLWDRNFYHNRLGKGTLLRELQTRGILNNGKSISYALGLIMSEYRGLPVVEHGGALFGYRTEVLRFPAQQFSVICLCNLSSANPGARARQVADIYLAGQLRAGAKPAAGTAPDRQPRPITVPASDHGAFAGLYRDPSDRSFVMATARDTGLQVRNPLAEPASPLEATAVLKPVSANLFADPKGLQYRFEPAANGGMRMIWDTGQGTTHVLERIQPARPTAAELAGYSGDYGSDELLATYKVHSKDGRLMVTAGWNDPVELQPSLLDEFLGRFNSEFREPIVIQFARVGAKIIGFDLFAGFADGVRDIRFIKK
jgi:CubicO group peptidase (beta-lactamase class C family)